MLVWPPALNKVHLPLPLSNSGRKSLYFSLSLNSLFGMRCIVISPAHRALRPELQPPLYRWWKTQHSVELVWFLLIKLWLLEPNRSTSHQPYPNHLHRTQTVLWPVWTMQRFLDLDQYHDPRWRRYDCLQHKHSAHAVYFKRISCERSIQRCIDLRLVCGGSHVRQRQVFFPILRLAHLSRDRFLSGVGLEGESRDPSFGGYADPVPRPHAYDNC